MARCVVGVDGGGTHTRAVVLDAQGRELGRADGRAAVADPRSAGAAAAAVAETCASAVGAAGRALPVDAVYAALTGAGREAARTAVELELGRLGVAARVHVGTDASAAFHDAFGNGPGILVISGTGSIAWGRSDDGRETRAGGWGLHVGDEGSGFTIGSQAMRRVSRQDDGRAPRTGLHGAILDFLGLGGVDDLVIWAGGASKGDVASLAKVVSAEAATGDAQAAEILAQAVRDLEAHVLAILEKLGPWRQPPSVALMGGLLNPGRPLREPLAAALARHRLPLVERPLDPALGAARLALARLG